MPSNASPERMIEVIEYADTHGEERAIKDLAISAATVAEYRKRTNQLVRRAMGGDAILNNSVLREIRERYSDKELKAIASGAMFSNVFIAAPEINFEGEEIVIGATGDTHMGNKVFIERYWDQFIERCHKEKCNFIIHTGDVVDGMAPYPGHIYELDHLGYDAQKEYAIEQLKKWDGEWYVIDGNHDRWYMKQSGAVVVKDICEMIGDSSHYLGHDEGDIIIKRPRGHENIKIRLWHGEDGDSYALSYRVQKILESFTGGEKPHIIYCGHTHKAVYMPATRNVQAISTGSGAKQSRYMRSKRRANHYGFWITRVYMNRTGIARFQAEWLPVYA